VLVDLYRLAQDHDDLDYASEQGMLDAYVGGRTGHVLRRLERRGLVSRARHMPEEGTHWVLTADGLQQARELVTPFGERGAAANGATP
jgi:manganese/zinc/iron transport system permease protein